MLNFVDGKIPAVMQTAITNILRQLAPDLPQQIDQLGKVVAYYEARLADIQTKQALILDILQRMEHGKSPSRPPELVNTAAVEFADSERDTDFGTDESGIAPPDRGGD